MTRRARLRLAAIAGSLALACAPEIAPVCAAPPAPIEPRDDEPFVVVGDTQRTFWAEAIVREQNEVARRRLMAELEAERPSEVVHLGDMVVYGSLESEWRYFDGLVSPLRCAGVPIHAVLGNHDTWGEPEAALANARRRFPELGSRFYARRHGRLGLVFLDSNLRGRAASIQRDWLRLTVDAFGRNRDVQAVIAFTHHPPYTLGKCRAGDPYVRDVLLPELRRSAKFVLMMSGHVHGYERFAGRPTFIVTGGGGGPRVEYRDGTSVRPFNYVVVRVRRDSLDLTARCLAGPGCPANGVLDHATIALP